MPGTRHVILGLVTLSGLAGAQQFVDRTVAAGLGAAPHGTARFGTGIAAGDLDGDRAVDLVIGASPGQPLRFYHNLGGLRFRDDTATAGLGNAAGEVHGLTLGDVDNDGDLDLYVCYWHVPPALFMNSGAGVFVEQAAARGLVHSTANFSANFGDYDRDGWLDLYVGNRGDPQVTGTGEPNLLYRNLGGGYFTDVTSLAGVGDVGLTFASTFVDYDEDGWPDLYVVNDKGTLVRPNRLYRNLGDGTFASVGAQVGAAIGMDGMGVGFADAYNDGGVDLVASDTGPDHLFLEWDPTTAAYVDRTSQLGIFSPYIGWAIDFLDYDNDGWQDLHVVEDSLPNSLFRNPARRLMAWRDVAWATGLAQGHAQFSTVVADFDDDGALDLCHRYQAAAAPFQSPSGLGLMHNQVAAGNWIGFRTRGTVSNRDGIGARVAVTVGSRTQRRWVCSGAGYLASSDLRLHFGLGGATIVDRVEVTWPSGQEQVLVNQVANRVVDLVEPSFRLRGGATVGGSATLELAVPGEAGRSYAMVLALTAQPGTPLGDGRVLPLRLDQLSAYSFVPGNALLPQPLGVLGPSATVSAPLLIPNLPFLAGLTLFATAATFGPGGIGDVRTIFPRAVTVTIR